MTKKPKSPKKKLKKRGPYNKRYTRKDPKDKFLEKYIQYESRIYKWLIYDCHLDILLCRDCVQTKITTQNM